jgi:uncharacterized RDD family membrane protein YckC
MNWYYALNDKQAGPVDDAEFLRLCASGVIRENTLVYGPGMTDWKDLASVKAAGLFPQPPAPIPPAPTPPGFSTPSIEGQVTCPSCARKVLPTELIPFQQSQVCVYCRDLVLQKVREGVDPRSGNLRYAGFGPRFLGSFIDGLIMQAYSLILNTAFGLEVTDSPYEGTLEPGMLGIYMILAIIPPLAFTIYFLGNPRFQATPGMMAAKIKITRPDGARVTYMRAFCRYLASIISSAILGIGYLMMLWDMEKRTLHDRMVDTRVVFR